MKTGLACCASSHAYDCECNTDYILGGKSGGLFPPILMLLIKEKRKEELMAQMEEINRERKFELCDALEGWHAAQNYIRSIESYARIHS